jgi:hypothetical protein
MATGAGDGSEIMSDDFHLSDEERARLKRMKRDLIPPARIEADLIEALRRRGLIRDPRARWMTAAILATSVAAGLVAALLVYCQIADRAPVAQPEFVLLLYAGNEAGATSIRHGHDRSPRRARRFPAWSWSNHRSRSPCSPTTQAHYRPPSLEVSSSCAPAISRTRNGLPPPARICATAVKSCCAAPCRDRVSGGV